MSRRVSLHGDGCTVSRKRERERDRERSSNESLNSYTLASERASESIG